MSAKDRRHELAIHLGVRYLKKFGKLKSIERRHLDGYLRAAVFGGGPAYRDIPKRMVGHLTLGCPDFRSGQAHIKRGADL